MHYCRLVTVVLVQAIALTLGRLYIYAAVCNFPDSRIIGILSQMSMAGVPLGHRHHSRIDIATFCGVAARVCRDMIRHRFALSAVLPAAATAATFTKHVLNYVLRRHLAQLLW